MNNIPLKNNSNYLKPYQTQTIYSCKKNAWFLINALKNITSNPTLEILVEISSIFPSNLERAPIDDLFYLYPYIASFYNYKKKVSDFISKKEINLNDQINLSKILQFLAFCDGYTPLCQRQ